MNSGSSSFDLISSNVSSGNPPLIRKSGVLVRDSVISSMERSASVRNATIVFFNGRSGSLMLVCHDSRKEWRFSVQAHAPVTGGAGANDDAFSCAERTRRPGNSLRAKVSRRCMVVSLTRFEWCERGRSSLLTQKAESIDVAHPENVKSED